MSSTNRASLINKLYKVAKKKYSPVAPLSNRGVLEHMLYACCLENGSYEAADEAFAKLEQQYYDWNEVRVTTTVELAETMKCLNRPEDVANSIKKTLHGIFETFYKFDLEHLKKENLRKTVQQLEKLRGVSPFVVSYTAQVALGGHSIPLDEAMLLLMTVLGIITEAEAEKGKVPGLERTIPKSKGVDFTSVAHQLAADLYKAPFNKDIRAFLLTIAPDAGPRFPKRGGRKKPEPEPAAEDSKTTASAETKESSAKDKATTKKSASVKSARNAKKKTGKKTIARSANKKTTSRKTIGKKTKAPKAAKKNKKSITKKSSKSIKKSPTKRLARKKPR